MAKGRLRGAREYALIVGVFIGLLCIVYGGIAAATWALSELTGCGHHCPAHAPDTDDARKLLLHLTDAGRARLQRERTLRAGALGTAIRETFDPDEKRRLSDSVALLSRLTARLTGH
ncbi:hypothetical protein ACPCBC_19545 [Streptomyces incarnatus]